MGFPVFKFPIFSLDTRSIAATRIAIGIIILVDLWRRSDDLKAFYTDEGVVPPDFIQHRTPLHRLFFYRGPPLLLIVHFVLTAAAALCMLLGLHTRYMVLLTQFLYTCIHGRNEDVNDCGERLVRSILLWLNFTPCWRAFSIDAIRFDAARKKAKEEGTLHANGDSAAAGEKDSVAGANLARSCGTAGLYVQFVCLYWAAVAARWPGHRWWWTESSAVYYSMMLDTSTPVGVYLAGFPALCKYLNRLTMFGETFLVPLMLVPNQKLRLAIIFLFAQLQIGIRLTIRLEILPWVAASMTTAFLPPIFWDSAPIQALLRRARSAMNNVIALYRSVAGAGAHTEEVCGRRRKGWFWRPVYAGCSVVDYHEKKPLNVVAAFFVIYIIMLNMGDVELIKKPDGGNIGEFLRVNQQWIMYAPDPPTTLYWRQWVGILSNGSEVDLLLAIRDNFRRAHPAWYARPALPIYQFKGLRWQMYSTRIAGHQRKMKRMAWFLCREWDRAALGPPLVAVDMFFHSTNIEPPGGRRTLGSDTLDMHHRFECANVSA